MKVSDDILFFHLHTFHITHKEDCDCECCLDAPVVSVVEERREHHPKLKQTNLTIACNVTADPGPDVNWARGRTVLSKYDNKVGMLYLSRSL